MAGFFDKDDDEKEVEEVSEEVVEEKEEAPEKIKIGDEEYDPEQLQGFVDVAKRAREAEEKYNTKYENIWPEFTKKSQQVKEMEAELEKLKGEIGTQAKSEGQPLSDEEIRKQAVAQARSLGLVTKEDFDQYYLQRREAERLLETCDDLEEEISGKDGRPAFKKSEILQYMADEGIKNPELAYKTKYEKEIDKWKDAQIKKAKGEGLVTEETSTPGARLPKEQKIDRNNLDDLTSAALRGEL